MKVSGIFMRLLLTIFCVFLAMPNAMAKLQTQSEETSEAFNATMDSFFMPPHSTLGPELRFALNAQVFKATLDGDLDYTDDTDTLAGVGVTLSIGYRFMFMGVYLDQNLAGIFGEQNHDYEYSRFLGSTYVTFRFFKTISMFEFEGGVGLGAMYMVSAHPDIMLDCDGLASSAASFAMKFTIGSTARFGGFGVGIHLDYELGINPQTYGKYNITQLLHSFQPGIHMLYKF